MFEYPPSRPHRRHGPKGYSDYSSFRPWLRDEFAFRCVYCLKRESWGLVVGEFDLDHFCAQAVRPDLATQYENLVYAFRRCNAVKSAAVIDDPFTVLTTGRIRSQPDGSVTALDQAARRIEIVLDLSSPRLIQWRLLWMRIVSLAEVNDPGLWLELTGLPRELPDLSQLRPPGGNSRPEGVGESWYATRAL